MAKLSRFGGVAVLLAIAVSPVRAQDTTAVPPPDTTEAPSAPSADPGELQGRVDGMSEQLQTLQTDMDLLKRFKFSGYVQARYEIAETSSDTVKVSGSPATLTPANRDRFFIRRARLKLLYDAAPLSQGVVYFNGSSTGGNLNVQLLEAYVTLMDPWTPDHRHQIWGGQMNVPFGYEIERSSSVRELPERSRAENVLFPGERERGVKLVDPWTYHFETVVGLFNGGGNLDATFGTEDPTRAKEVTGRARLSLGWLDAAGSAYVGKGLLPLTGPDVEFDRTRFGGDAQLYYALPAAGGGSLRAELYVGENLNPDSTKALVQAASTANPVTLLKPGANRENLATDFLGWYVMWVQNLGDKLQVAARYEEWDQDTNVDHDEYWRTSLGVNYFYDGYTRLTASYDIPVTDVSAGGGKYTDPHDNLWTLQLQIKF